MKAEKLGNWLQIGANIGVLLGLLLVGIQISENTKIARAELVSSTFEIANQYQLAMLGENPADVIARIDPSAASESELAVLEAQLWFWHNFDSRYEFLIDAGLADPAYWPDYLEIHARLFYGGTPLRREIWKKITAGKPDLRWEGIVDAYLATAD